jgi:hypothetical protein
MPSAHSAETDEPFGPNVTAIPALNHIPDVDFEAEVE